MNELNRKKLNEYKEKLRLLNTELKSMKTMLDKGSNNWVKFDESLELLHIWLEEQEKIDDLVDVRNSTINLYSSSTTLIIFQFQDRFGQLSK